MAFTTTQKLNICKILRVEMPILEYALLFNVAYIDSTAETQVAAELTRWTTAGVNFVNIHPKDRNYGVEIRHEAEKADIRRNIATLLLMTDTVYGGGSASAQVSVQRG